MIPKRIILVSRGITVYTYSHEQNNITIGSDIQGGPKVGKQYSIYYILYTYFLPFLYNIQLHAFTWWSTHQHKCWQLLLIPRFMMSDEISSPIEIYHTHCIVKLVLWATWWWPTYRVEICNCILYIATNCNIVMFMTMYIWIYTQYSFALLPVIRDRLSETWIFETHFRKILKYKISYESIDWKPNCSMRTDVHYEAIFAVLRTWLESGQNFAVWNLLSGGK